MTGLTLLNAEDLLDDVRDIVECLWMASATVEDSAKTSAMQTVASCALHKVEKLREVLKKARAEAR